MFLWDTKGNNKVKKERKVSRRRVIHHDEPVCVSSLRKMMKLNDATATELSDVLPDLSGNEKMDIG